MSEWRGKVLLVVNTASKCGFTPQYKGLEALQQRFAGRGFAVLGFPCNQFGHQEPGDESEIVSFCDRTIGVTFPMHTKVEVNGANTHPLFAHLKHASPGILGTEAIKWNFTKFLVGKDGKVLKRYAPQTTPDELVADIQAALDA
jgi:glutathione peroxidase